MDESCSWLERGKRVTDRFLWGAAGAGHGESIVTVGANVLSSSMEVVHILLRPSWHNTLIKSMDSGLQLQGSPVLLLTSYCGSLNEKMSSIDSHI